MENNKQTRGRQKIDMKRRENEEDRLVTFSKRRAGIFKKASELCTLCGVDIGLIIFSPSDKPFSFAHPNIDSIVNRLLNRNPQTNDNATLLFEARRQAKIDEYNEKLNKLRDEIEVEKERGRKLDEIARARPKGWWEGPIDQFTKEQTTTMLAWLKEIQAKIKIRMSEMGANNEGSSMTLPNDIFVNPIDPSFASASGTNENNANPSSYAHDAMQPKND